MVLSLTRVLRLACAMILAAAAVFIASAVDARADPGLFATGWTNIVPTGSNAFHTQDVLFYKKGSSVASTGYFDDAGHFHQMSSSPGISTDWTHIVGSPYTRYPR